MRAALAALLIAGSVTPASAAFRYVPPANTGPGEMRSGEPHTVEPAAKTVPEPWRVHAGETLREVLARWGARAGVEVQFLTDRRYRLHGAGAFEGGFDGAVQALFKALGHLPHPPEGQFAMGGGSLAVTHRAPNLFDLENGP